MCKGGIQVILVMSVILWHEKTKIQKIIGCGNFDVLSVKTIIHNNIKRWATLFDLWGFSYMRFLENEMSQDDTRLVGWLLWLAKHTFFATQVLFQLNKSFKWIILCLICIFWAVILHHIFNCVILWHLEKQGCPDDFKFKFSIWDTGRALGSKQERFWNQKTKVWGHFG